MLDRGTKLNNLVYMKMVEFVKGDKNTCGFLIDFMAHFYESIKKKACSFTKSWLFVRLCYPLCAEARS